MQTRSEDIFGGPKTVHVYSTLTNDQLYPVYQKRITEDDMVVNVIEAHVHIAGGAHRMNKRLESPAGVLTSISEKALAHLKESPIFMAHVKRGFITYREKQVDIERAVADHNSERDPSAQLTPEDWMNEDPNETPIPTTKAADVGKGRKVVPKRQADWK